MKRSLVLSIIFFILSIVCFAGAYSDYRKKEDIKRSSDAAGIYLKAQQYITTVYAAKGEILDVMTNDEFDNDSYEHVRTFYAELSKDYKFVTVKGAPLIDYVEYKGHKYPEVDKDSDIFSLTDDVKDFNLRADE
ncbi:MAG: hypothetical protein IJR59_06300, partial [Firmicutes bacterium]|nr:hypothetical protein [Bacillota bacterium]